jgi:outer membrane protein OmpA-like peptidoglycan-associated protein
MTRVSKRTASLMASAFFLFAFATATRAGEISEQDIFKALTTSKTRSLTTSQTSGTEPSAPDHQVLVNALRHRGVRSLTAHEREEIAMVAEERPAVDLEVFFEFNSEAILPKAMPQIDKLGNALTQPEIGSALFSINGHTDAVGSDTYNDRLSERRAEAIKRYLVDHFRMPSQNLVTAGYGKRKLKNPADPFGAENRRVQVVNLSSQAER